MKSMTAFARVEGEIQHASYSLEMKCVNHRFLDIHLHLPAWLVCVELPVHGLIKQRFKRGKIDLWIQSQKSLAALTRAGALEHAKEAGEWLYALRRASGLSGKVEFGQLLTMKELFALYPENAEKARELWPDLEPLVVKLCDEADGFRQREGEFLQRELGRIVEQVVPLLQAIETRVPQVVIGYQKRLHARIAELVSPATALDAGLLATEVALFADRSDITEELVRLRSHLKQWKTLQAGDSGLGRKLDFLIQEMNREVNTIASKGNDSQISQYSVELKTLLERMREQIQNIE